MTDAAAGTVAVGTVAVGTVAVAAVAVGAVVVVVVVVVVGTVAAANRRVARIGQRTHPTPGVAAAPTCCGRPRAPKAGTPADRTHLQDGPFRPDRVQPTHSAHPRVCHCGRAADSRPTPCYWNLFHRPRHPREPPQGAYVPPGTEDSTAPLGHDRPTPPA